MKTAIVGDLHGRVEVVDAILEKHDSIVFIGDYLDSFDRTKLDQLATIERVIKAHENSDTITALQGNHERSYVGTNYNRCSGWNGITDMNIIDIKENIRSLPMYIWVDEFLVTHAGISKIFLNWVLREQKGSEGQSDRDLVDYYLANGTEGDGFDTVGITRGGHTICGGLLWCDWFQEFIPIDGIPQIVGHSGYRPLGQHIGILQKGNSYNIDCLDHVYEYLIVDGFSIQVEKLEV